MARRLTILLTIVLCATPVSAISLFNKHWQTHYLTDNSNESFVSAARKAGCYVCHVKGKPKQEVRNEYGAALARYLDADDFLF